MVFLHDSFGARRPRAGCEIWHNLPRTVFIRTGNGLYLRRTKDEGLSDSSLVALQTVYIFIMSGMFSEMISGVRMRVLEVFLLAVLGCSLAGGRLVSKCELKDQLMMAIGQLMMKAEKGKGVENLVAKIVCHVELASDFNTSDVDQLIPGMEAHHSREKREAGYEGLFGLAEPQGPLITIRPHTRERRDVRHPPSNTWPTPPTSATPSTRLPQPDEEVWTLYGLFQLSSHLVCSSDMTPSPNICGMDCNNLIDDNISDDISCVMMIFKQLIINIIYQQQCSNQKPSEYFAECS